MKSLISRLFCLVVGVGQLSVSVALPPPAWITERPVDLPPPVPGQNAALSFWTGDSVKVSNSPSLDFTGPFTVEAWVKPDETFHDEFFKFIVSKQLSGTGYTLLGYGDSTAQFESFNFPGGPTFDATAGGVFGTQWTHVAGVWNGAMNLLYVNGSLVASAANPHAPVSNTLDLYIGGSIFGGNTSWHGMIDEVRAWNYARTGTQISNNRSVSYTAPQTGLVGYWKFDEGSGMIAGDSSGRGNIGYLDPPVWVSAADLVLTPGAADAGAVSTPENGSTWGFSIFGIGLLILGSSRAAQLR